MSEPLPPAPSGDAPPLNRLHVLLADDQVIHAMIVGKWLGMLGCTMERVENGLQAVERWQQGRFDLILMDVQMPVMDGLEAAARIRELERGSAAAVPIVAMTAGTSPRERERCLAAGMDAHLAKPIALDGLAAAMREALSRAATCRPPAAEPAQALEEPAAWTLDLERLRQSLGGDEALLTEFVQAMRSELGLRLERLQAAALAADSQQACVQAHALRGALGSVGAEPAAALTRALESDASAHAWPAFQQTLARLRTELAAIEAALAAAC